ncbi:unnamed protein product [Symbiodinium sp. CCMP2592]|nr:unnamed protein product [Symbiodinium sp. CCMP2592]
MASRKCSEGTMKMMVVDDACAFDFFGLDPFNASKKKSLPVGCFRAQLAVQKTGENEKIYKVTSAPGTAFMNALALVNEAPGVAGEIMGKFYAVSSSPSPENLLDPDAFERIRELIKKNMGRAPKSTKAKTVALFDAPLVPAIVEHLQSVGVNDTCSLHLIEYNVLLSEVVPFLSPNHVFGTMIALKPPLSNAYIVVNECVLGHVKMEHDISNDERDPMFHFNNWKVQQLEDQIDMMENDLADKKRCLRGFKESMAK